MTDKQLNKAICKELQKVAASFFNEVSGNIKNFGDSFTTRELCKLSEERPELFGIYTEVIDIKTVDFWGNESSEKGFKTITGKKETICIGDFKCTFDLSNIFELLYKFERLSGIKKMAFVIEEEKADAHCSCTTSSAEHLEEEPGIIAHEEEYTQPIVQEEVGKESAKTVDKDKSMSSANRTRAEKSLNKLTRYNGKILTIKDFLNELKNEGYMPRISEKSSVKYSRTKYNRMNYDEQREYERKLDTMIPMYMAVNSDGVFHELKKFEYDYFSSLFDECDAVSSDNTLDLPEQEEVTTTVDSKIFKQSDDFFKIVISLRKNIEKGHTEKTIQKNIKAFHNLVHDEFFRTVTVPYYSKYPDVKMANRDVVAKFLHIVDKLAKGNDVETSLQFISRYSSIYNTCEEIAAVTEPERNVVCIECDPDYWDSLSDVPDTGTETPATVCLDTPTNQAPERVHTVFAGERLLTVFAPERPLSVPLFERLRLIPFASWHYLITGKGMYYLIA